jgi:hypothetical protein
VNVITSRWTDRLTDRSQFCHSGINYVMWPPTARIR